MTNKANKTWIKWNSKMLVNNTFLLAHLDPFDKYRCTRKESLNITWKSTKLLRSRRRSNIHAVAEAPWHIKLTLYMFLVWGMGCWKISALFIQRLSISSTSHSFFTAIVPTYFLQGETTPSTLLRLKISCWWWWAEDKNMITDVTDKLPVKDIFEMSCRPDRQERVPLFQNFKNSTFKGDKMNQILSFYYFLTWNQLSIESHSIESVNQ